MRWRDKLDSAHPHMAASTHSRHFLKDQTLDSRMGLARTLRVHHGCPLYDLRADRGDVRMIEPQRRRWPLAFDQEQLAETLTREGGAQFEGCHEPFEALREIVERRLIPVRKALDQPGVAEEGFPAAAVVTLELGRILQYRP